MIRFEPEPADNVRVKFNFELTGSFPFSIIKTSSLPNFNLLLMFFDTSDLPDTSSFKSQAEDAKKKNGY